MIRDTLTASLRDALTAVGLRPARRRSTSSGRPAASTGTGRATWRWPPRRLRSATPATSPARSPTTSTPTRHHTSSASRSPGRGSSTSISRARGCTTCCATSSSRARTDYARHGFGEALPVNVEFVSANPTGPLHAGGGRWAAYGDALCNLLERCGYAPSREYYLNDRGTQMRAVRPVAGRQPRPAQPIPEDGYKGEYIEEWAAEMPDGADPARVGLRAGQARTSAKRSTAWASTTTRGSASGRSSSPARSRPRSRSCASKGMAYDADGATWIRTEQFGDRKDQVIVRSNGEPAYLLPDLAYHRDKFARGFGLLVDVWGADHHGYVPSMKAGWQALGHDADELESILGQLVTLMRDGAAGTAVEARRRPRAARRPARRGRPRRGPAHVPAAVARHPPDDRLGRHHRAVDGEPRLLRADGARPDLRHRPQGGRRRRRPGPDGAGRPRPPHPRARARRAPVAQRAARRRRRGLQRPRAAPGDDVGARAGWRLPRLLPRLLRHRRGHQPGADPGAALARRGDRASASPSGSACSA